MNNFDISQLSSSLRRQNYLAHSQSQPKLSNRQAINMIKLLNRYQYPQHSQDLSPQIKIQNNYSSYSQSSHHSPRFNRKRSLHYHKENDPNYVNQRVHIMLEKEIQNLKSDLNRLRAYEYEQNKRYEDQIINMMKEQQKYPPPSFFF